MSLKDQLKLRKAAEEKEPINMDPDELVYASKPIGKSYIQQPKQPQISEKPGYLICKICGKEYAAKNSGKHKRTQYHLLHEKMNNKIRCLLLGNLIIS